MLARRAVHLLAWMLACVSLGDQATAQQLPNFPPPAMKRQCPRTANDVKFMAPNLPTNSPCKFSSRDSPYCDPPPCFSGKIHPITSQPQGGCLGTDKNGNVSGSGRACIVVLPRIGAEQCLGVGSRTNSATSTPESARSASQGTAASPWTRATCWRLSIGSMLMQSVKETLAEPVARQLVGADAPNVH
eukprot:COSAG02_NODE_17999_length_966_cov_2.317186_1_plen_187_part_01